MLGKGVINGMVETAMNFLGSYVQEDRLVTVQYPEERLPQKEAARSFPFLVHDGADSQQGLRCVACQICEKECPPQCIYIVKDITKKPDSLGKLQFQPKVFDIDLSVCMSCQICAEVCPFDAIKMDVEYELSTADRFGGLLRHKADLAKANAYFHRIHPVEAAEVDARLAAEKAKAEAKVKADAAKAKAALAPNPRRWLWPSEDSPHVRDPGPTFHPPQTLVSRPRPRVLATVDWRRSFGGALIAVFAGLFALTTILERKILGRIQNRYGPNRVGPWGLLQPLADGLKTLTKEDLVPAGADRLMHFLAPLALVVPVFLALSVVPMGRNLVALDLDAGMLFFFAVGAATELSVFMAGWSSRNKYSLLGAMRALAQMLSYEVPLILSTVTVIMAAGSPLHGRHCRSPGGLLGPAPTMVRAHPLGPGGLPLIPGRRHRRIQPRSLRPPRG